MTDLQTFREETRDWLESNCPEEMRKPGDVAWGGRNAQFLHPLIKNFGLSAWAKKVGLVPHGPKDVWVEVSQKKRTKFFRRK